MPNKINRPFPMLEIVCSSTMTLAWETRWIRRRMGMYTGKQENRYTGKPSETCLLVYLLYLLTPSRQRHRLADFCHCLLGNGSSAFRSIVQHISHIVWFGGEFGAFGAERFEMLVQICCKEFFTINATNSGAATFNVDHIYFCLRRKYFMHREDVANIRVTGVRALHTRRVRDHLFHTREGLFGCGGKFDVIIQTLAHLGFAINAQHFENFGMLHLRLD